MSEVAEEKKAIVSSYREALRSLVLLVAGNLRLMEILASFGRRWIL